MSWLKNPSSFNKIFFSLIVVYFAVIIFNDGFMGTDEYWTGITRYIPAQKSNLHTLVSEDDVKSPLQILPMHLVAQTALAIGVEHPYYQYRIVVFTIGLLCISLLALAFYKLFKNEYENNPEFRNLSFLLLTFYCAAPFAFTRPMFESMAAPWLTLSAVYLYLYDHLNEKKYLYLSVIFVCMSFLLRQQTGVCALALLFTPLLKKQWKDFFIAGSIGLFIFILLGIPDFFLRGSFHYSLKAVLFYNIAHGQEYGQQSILTYPLMLLGISFSPFLIKKYPTGFISHTFKKYRVFALYILFFTVMHSMFPQKFERFLISIIPHVLILMLPFLYEIFKNYQQHKLRIACILILNFALFIPASFFPAQKNLIAASLYFDQHPEIHKVYRFPDAPPWVTDAFIQQQKYQFIDIDEASIPNLKLGENEYLMLTEHDYNRLKLNLNEIKPVAEFSVNWIESFAYRFNPQKNIRRTPLILLK